VAMLPVKDGPVAFVERQLEMLSVRDRRLLVGLVVAVTLVFIGGYWTLLNGLLNDKASRVREAKSALQVVRSLEAEYQQAAALFRAQEARLTESSKRPVTAWVEELATRHGLQEHLKAVDAGQSEVVGDLAQTRYKVQLRRAAQEPLYRFLHELETSDVPASVEEATFKVAYVKKEKFMDLTLELLVLSLAGG